jgi:hypothetical protein
LRPSFQRVAWKQSWDADRAKSWISELRCDGDSKEALMKTDISGANLASVGTRLEDADAVPGAFMSSPALDGPLIDPGHCIVLHAATKHHI